MIRRMQMSTNTQLVDIPKYAKLNKKGYYYALKRDMPYFADEPGIKGLFPIGTPSDVEGKMIPDINYHRFCTEESYQEKMEAIRIREEEEAAAREEKEKNFGESFISLNELHNEIRCYPVKGFLVERFFEETGLGDILDEVFGPDLANFLKLSAGLLATDSETLDFDCLNDYPMKKHMLYRMNRFLTTTLWSSIEDNDVRRVFQAWIEKVKPESVSATLVRSTMTLYHDQYSDSMGDGWFFSSRIRTGTRYHVEFLFYRDNQSHMLLAAEREKTYFSKSFDDYKPSELYTIENSDYPSLQNASLHIFYPSYTFFLPDAAKTRPSTFCYHPSAYLDAKELTKKLRALEKLPIVSGYRILKWEGSLKDVNGNWALVEIADQRKDITDTARNIMNSEKKRLQAMSYYPACMDPSSCYFEIEKESEEADVFDNLPFTVKSKSGATKRISQDFGRYLFFSNEGPFDNDDELLSQIWRDDDLIFQFTSYMNQGHTVDVTDEYSKAMAGREFPMFLASMFREWIFDHIGDLFKTEKDSKDPLEVTTFLKKASRWGLTIQSNGTVEPDELMGEIDAELVTLLKRFNVSPDDIINYLTTVIKQKHYFSDSYERW